MARMKPQVLLQKSKQKKSPATFGRTVLLVGTALVAFFTLLVFVRHRQSANRLQAFQDDLDDSLPYFSVLNTTHGLIYLELFKGKTPRTVKNFVTHSQSGYYNGVCFHRVIKKFMIQGGDPLGDGTGGESIWGGSFEDEFHPSLKHEPFTLSMANHGPNTNGAQFFITTVSTPYLDNHHTVFGRVVKGHNVVKAIENVETDSSDRPKVPVLIHNIAIIHEL